VPRAWEVIGRSASHGDSILSTYIRSNVSELVNRLGAPGIVYAVNGGNAS